VRYAGAIRYGSADSDIIGAKTRVKIVKNKLAPPFRTVYFPIIFGEGISNIDIIIETGIEMGLIKKSGSWFSYEDVKLGQGMEKTKQYLKDTPELLQEIEEKVRAKAIPETMNSVDTDAAEDKSEE